MNKIEILSWAPITFTTGNLQLSVGEFHRSAPPPELSNPTTRLFSSRPTPFKTRDLCYCRPI